jgi:hypothetical protein
MVEEEVRWGVPPSVSLLLFVNPVGYSAIVNDALVSRKASWREHIDLSAQKKAVTTSYTPLGAPGGTVAERSR